MKTCPYGFRIVGALFEERRLVDADAAFKAYCSCDPRADVNREAYLSAFTFGEDFRELLTATSSTRGFSGPCWAPFVWWDIDREDDLDAALRDARRLALALVERFKLSEDLLSLFFSGSKGFHLGLPTSLWNPEPSATFNRIARRFADQLAGAVAVVIDGGVYDKVRPFRAPNSRHPKTGRHKRRLSFEELQDLSLARILDLAAAPEPFELPSVAATCDQAAADWQAAHEAVQKETEEKAERQRAVANGAPRLNRATLDFIREGADQGDRHRLLFSAAANLAEFACPPALAHALLTEAALDSGLTPADVRRQIECGLQRGKAGAGGDPPAGPTPSTPAPSTPVADPSVLQQQLAALWATPSLSPPRTDDAGALDADQAGKASQAEQELPTRPTPPAGAKLCFQDARGRPCPASDAVRWTWEGASAWFDAAECPIPTGQLKGGEG